MIRTNLGKPLIREHTGFLLEAIAVGNNKLALTIREPGSSGSRTTLLLDEEDTLSLAIHLRDWLQKNV